MTSFEFWAWLLGGSCFALALLPFIVYFCVKFGRMGYLNAERQFKKHQNRSNTEFPLNNGDDDVEDPQRART